MNAKVAKGDWHPSVPLRLCGQPPLFKNTKITKRTQIKTVELLVNKSDIKTSHAKCNVKKVGFLVISMRNHV